MASLPLSPSGKIFFPPPLRGQKPLPPCLMAVHPPLAADPTPRYFLFFLPAAKPTGHRQVRVVVAVVVVVVVVVVRLP